MESQLQIDGLKEEFQKAKISHDGVRQSADPVVYQIREVNERIAQLRKELADVNQEHDLMNRHIRKHEARNNYRKANKKKRRRDEYGFEKARLTQQLKEANGQKRELVDALRELRDGTDYWRIENAYYSVRHQLMTAIQTAEIGDEAARQRKSAYLRALITAGQLPQQTKLDELLYYVYAGKVHVFYGGRQSYGKTAGTSPDGQGHGHYVLAQRYDGKYECQFSRSPN